MRRRRADLQDPRGPQPGIVGERATVAKNMLARTAEGLRLQLTQRALDRELGIRFPRKAWSRFCQGGKWDATVAHTGKGSLAVDGGTYTATMPQWKYFNRQGAAQFVSLNQTAPQPIVLRGVSKAREVATSEKVVLDTPAAPAPLRRPRGPHLLHAPLPGLPGWPVAPGAYRALLARHPRLGGEEHPRGAHPPGEDGHGAAGIPPVPGRCVVRRSVYIAGLIEKRFGRGYGLGPSTCFADRGRIK